MRKTSTIPAAYFEEKYQADLDPWRFKTSDYERDKYRATLASLTKARYASALEVGCSIGILTRLLSRRCDHLLAIDASATAIKAARRDQEANVDLRVATLPAEYPDGSFDLIVLSEVLYYFDEADLQRVARSCISSILPGGDIVLCHWLGETDYPLTGVEASELFAASVKNAMPVRSILHDDVYRLERFAMPPMASSAAAR
jgi:2-polyprenyl-3-methyl-5-hydroxy-6-metoxy-1,4-benzoquinol methylase